MLVTETQRGEVRIELEPEEMDKIEMRINKYLDNVGANEDANHYDIIDILEKEKIIIRNGVPNVNKKPSN